MITFQGTTLLPRMERRFRRHPISKLSGRGASTAPGFFSRGIALIYFISSIYCARSFRSLAAPPIGLCHIGTTAIRRIRARAVFRHCSGPLNFQTERQIRYSFRSESMGQTAVTKLGPLRMRRIPLALASRSLSITAQAARRDSEAAERASVTLAA